MTRIFEYISEEAGNKTKRKQIVDGIVQAIVDKEVQQGDMLPSVNMFINKLQMARMTVVTALEELKERGIVESERRVGFFVKKAQVRRKLQVMLFLTEFNVYHEVAYNEIVAGLDSENVTLDLFFHHCNPHVFKTILKENVGHYGLYIVTPFNHPIVTTSLAEIPSRKLLQVMRMPQVSGSSFISQDFDEEVFNALKTVQDKLLKYKRFVLVFPRGDRHPREIEGACIRFCRECCLDFECLDHVEVKKVDTGMVYFVIADNALIDLVKIGDEKGLKLGKSFGILSYNDTPMKSIIRNGISVISTDFRAFGKEINRFIRTRQPVQKRISTKITLRNSL